MLSDPQLALQMIFGPCSPYHYRLTGPFPWSGARQAILSVWDRTLYPLNSSVTASLKDKSRESSLLKLAFVVPIFAIFLHYILV